jgi:hypothetical protein
MLHPKQAFHRPMFKLSPLTIDSAQWVIEEKVEIKGGLIARATIIE